MPMDVGTIAVFLVGAFTLIVGMGLFQLGAEMAMTPLGQDIGKTLTFKNKIVPLLLCSLVIGVLITVAEPDLQVLANQVASIPNNALIFTVAAGVGIFLALAVFRIYKSLNLSAVLMILYGILFIMSAITPSSFVTVAFDAGGVTTGPMTVPFIMALGVGISASRTDKGGAADSFGLIALCSVGPILMVMILGICYNPSEALYNLAEIAPVISTQDVMLQFLASIPKYLGEVALSIAPAIALFAVFEILTRQYRKHQLLRMCVGFLYVYIGLVLFLTGVNVGFAPVGNLLGSKIASREMKWLLVPIGAVIGYYIVKAEPAIAVLNLQVEQITGGTVTRKMMGTALSISVSCAAAISMVRVLAGFSIYWIVIPGYFIALLLTRFTPSVFVGIAFDSGGVASGPMASTFLLPLSMGACIAVDGNVVTDAFGVIALVALAPLIAIQLMGIIYNHKSKKQGHAALEISEQIVDLEETDYEQ